MEIDKDKLFVIGGHNSMTYFKPKTIFGYIGNVVAKCQNKSIFQLLHEQYRVFDIRISYDKYRNIEYRHGLVRYKSKINLKDLLNQLDIDSIANKIIIRIILEHYNDTTDIDNFTKLCKYIEVRFNNIIFIGGNVKKTWKKVYQFDNNITDADIYQWVSSMANDAHWYEKVCPYLYAKRKNKDNMKLANKIGKGIHLFDFL